MLCSSAASNETGILDQKFARSLGMVAIDCQARLCHGPTVAALAPTFGRGAMTNNWVDIKKRQRDHRDGWQRGGSTSGWLQMGGGSQNPQ
ncbi:hypothetical protein DZJ_50440 [Dickeya ananatis]